MFIEIKMSFEKCYKCTAYIELTSGIAILRPMVEQCYILNTDQGICCHLHNLRFMDLLIQYVIYTPDRACPLVFRAI